MQMFSAIFFAVGGGIVLSIEEERGEERREERSLLCRDDKRGWYRDDKGDGVGMTRGSGFL